MNTQTEFAEFDEQHPMRLTVPPNLVRTNRRETRTERFRRNPRGLPSLRDMAAATRMLDRLTSDGVMKLTRDELFWADGVVNFKRG